MFFILDDQNKPIPTTDRLDWSEWHSGNENRCCIGDDTVKDVRVSTRFFGTEISHIRCLWETVALHGYAPLHEYTRRHGNYEDAVRGHRETIERIRGREERGED